MGNFEHLPDGSDARNRLFAEGPDAVADGSQQLAVNVNRTTAHTRDYACVLRLSAFQAGEDHVLPGAEGVVEQAENLDAHRLRLRAFKNGVSYAVQAAMHLVYRVKPGCRWRRSGGQGRGGGLRHKRRSGQ